MFSSPLRIVVLPLALAASGCYSSYVLDRPDLVKLDGFEHGDRVVLFDRDGDRFEFTSGTPLTIIDTNLESTEAMGYQHICCDGVIFHGFTVDGEEVEFTLDEIDRVEVEAFDLGMTLLAIGTAPIWGPPYILLHAFFLCLSSDDDDFEDDDWGPTEAPRGDPGEKEYRSLRRSGG